MNSIAALLTETHTVEPRSARGSFSPSNESGGTGFANFIAELGADDAAAGFVPDPAQPAAGAQDAAGKAQALANLLAQALADAGGAQAAGIDAPAVEKLSALDPIPDDVKAALLAAMAQRAAPDAEADDAPETEDGTVQNEAADAPLAAALTIPAGPAAGEAEAGIQTFTSSGAPSGAAAAQAQPATPAQQAAAAASGNGTGQEQTVSADAAIEAAATAKAAGNLAKGAGKTAGATAQGDRTGAAPSSDPDAAGAKSDGDKKPETTGLARAAEQANARAKPQIEAAAARHALLSAQESQGKPAQQQSLPDTTLPPAAPPAMDTALGARASAVAVPPSGQALPVAALAMQIAGYARAGASRFEIRMDPPELGRVDVRLHVAQDGSVSTRMIVERPETLDLLMRDARALERALGDAGLKTDDGSLRFSLRGDGFAQHGQNGAQQDPDGHGARTRVELDDDMLDTAAQAAPRASLTASNGLDIRI